MKKTMMFLLALLSVMAVQAQVSLAGQWDFRLNDGPWGRIQVPGNWEMQGFDTPRYGKGLVKSTAVYRRTFTVPAEWKDKLVRITFEGVNYGYTFMINGREGGSFHSSYNRRVFDITPLVKCGAENVIEVMVETQPFGYLFDCNDDWSLSGISRPVYISAVPKTHVEDVTVRTSLQGGNAVADFDMKIENALKAGRLSVEGAVIDAKGNVVNTFNAKGAEHCSASVQMQSPHLWSAETPYLYTLRLKVKRGKKVLHTYSEKFGVREVTWDDCVFRINGTAVKLRGVNHHDLSPVNGRAITDAELLKDMQLLKAANINAIRMSHYPPSVRLLELCDSMGMYVIDEVPYGYGDEWLGKSEYLPELKQRAYYTLLRDKNHPSVVIWSVGNENPITAIGLETGKYVYSMDNTRPYVFPQTHAPFGKMLKNDYDSITMYSAHYPKPGEFAGWARATKHPIVNTEYAHALGLDFGMMQECVEKWYQYPQMAGGCVWELFDQGLLRKSEKPVDRTAFTNYAWLDATTYYDTDSINGCDGILYANRLPQVDYWQVRKVYAPVKMALQSYGNGRVKLRFINRHDFTNLSDIKLAWTLRRPDGDIRNGIITLDCAPHDTAFAELDDISMPEGEVTYLTVEATDNNGRKLTEQAFRLDSLDNMGVWRAMNQKAAETAWDRQRLLAWVQSSVYARVGKKLMMSERTCEASGKQLWQKRILPCTEAVVERAAGDSVRIKCRFVCDSLHEVGGYITLRKTACGGMDVHYRLAATGGGQATETGLSILVPDVTTVRWMGSGPYAAYPGKDLLSEFGCWQLNTDDIYFPGNRKNVSVMLLTDGNGCGTVLVPHDEEGNIALERYPQGIIVSHNAAVSKPYNKKTRPKYVPLDGTPIEGMFTISHIGADWSRQLQKAFGSPQRQVESYAPFYHSYDQ